MTSPAGTINVADSLSQNLIIHKNVDQEIIYITTDKTRICLMKHWDYLSKSNDWVAPACTLATTSTTLYTATFISTIFNAAYLQALYTFAAIGSLIWLLYSLIKKWQRRKHRGVDEIISELAALSAGAAGGMPPPVTLQRASRRSRRVCVPALRRGPCLLSRRTLFAVRRLVEGSPSTRRRVRVHDLFLFGDAQRPKQPQCALDHLGAGPVAAGGRDGAIRVDRPSFELVHSVLRGGPASLRDRRALSRDLRQPFPHLPCDPI